ncbi:TIGR00730 family Rossman fold protein [Candidatus Saccharibacteria bacterium]|nr:TIGR00730 family Rossman fold protein [Candidatus Saccharibacteria bacterium]
MKNNQSEPLSVEAIQEACQLKHDDETSERVCRINEEITQGLELISHYPKKVTFFGSARFKEDHPEYQKARNLAKRLVSELDYTIVTGGAGGIMEAANRGAKEAGGNSLGLNIKLPAEQITNPFVTQAIPFRYFFTRKVILSFASRMYIYFPGGFGTMDEFYEILTLVQTRKIHKVPIVCVGAYFWETLDRHMHHGLMLPTDTIDETDMGLYTITDSEDTIMEIARSAQARK